MALVGKASSVDILVVDEWLNTKLPLLMTDLVNIYKALVHTQPSIVLLPGIHTTMIAR